MIKCLWILFLLTGYACNGCGNREEGEQHDSYVFPYKTIVETLPDGCAASGEDQLLKLGSGLENILLGAFSKPVTTADELKYGKQMALAIKKETVFVEDKRTGKLRAILNKMRPFFARKDIPYTIVLVQDTLVNAWTHAGGNIYLTTALLDFVESDDELAFVIAHEIGHNENEHCRKPVHRLKAAMELLDDKDFASMASDLLAAVFAPFDQHQELVADISAIYLTYAAGYDPKRSKDFFRKLVHSEEENVFDKFLRSHPWSSERIGCVEHYLNHARK